MISLPAMIERAARLNPDGVATSYAGRQSDWTATRDRVAKLAGALQACKLAEGDRVSILLSLIHI